MAPNYKLIYFDGKGRAETIRFIFAAAGVKYEDYRVKQEDWPALKPTMPFEALPVLEVDGKKLADSGAISRYLSEKHGLMGKNPLERAQIDACCEVITSFREKMIEMHFSKESEKAEKTKTFGEKTMPEIMGKLEKTLKNCNGGDKFFFGDKLSLADLHFATCVEPIVSMHPEAMAKFPKLDELYKRVTADKKINKWMVDRPETKF